MIPHGSVIAFDTEATGLLYRNGDQAFAMCFCNREGETGYVDFDVDPYTRLVLYDDRLKAVRSFLQNERIAKVMHNAPYDQGIMEHGAECVTAGDVYDTMTEVHCCYSKLPTYALKPLAKRFQICDDEDEKELQQAVVKARAFGRARGWMLAEATEGDYWTPKAVDSSSVLCETYGTTDAVRTMMLHLLCQEFFAGNTWAKKAFEFEALLKPLLDRMMNRGLFFSVERNDAELKRCVEEEAAALVDLRAAAKRQDFDPDKPNQVRWFLFDHLHLEAQSFTKTGKPEASQESLSLYRKEPSVKPLFKYRAANKGRTSFFQKFDLYKARNADGEWCIHPNLKQAGLATGRLACKMPNLMGTGDAGSSRSENPVESRLPFGPRPGHVWILGDYSQLEVRIFAKLSNDKKMMQEILDGRDLHGEYAERVWGGRGNSKALEAAMEALDTDRERDACDWLESFNYDIVKAEASLGKKNSRSRGKAVFFTRMFFGGKNSFMKKLHCTLREALDLIEEIDTMRPRMIGWLQEMQRSAEGCGYITTMYGRVLDVPKDESYKAGSYRVQGSAADIIKRSMLSVDEILQKETDGRSQILLPIHDELILELPYCDVKPSLLRKVKTAMEIHGDVLGFPLPVEFEITDDTWSKTEKIAWSL